MRQMSDQFFEYRKKEVGDKVRLSVPHKRALSPPSPKRKWDHTVETIKLDPVAVGQLTRSLQGLVTNLLPAIQVDVRRAVRWTPALKQYVLCLRQEHGMTYPQIVDHLNHAYGTHLFNEDSLACFFYTQRHGLTSRGGSAKARKKAREGGVANGPRPPA